MSGRLSRKRSGFESSQILVFFPVGYETQGPSPSLEAKLAIFFNNSGSAFSSDIWFHSYDSIRSGLTLKASKYLLSSIYLDLSIEKALIY